MCTFMTNSWEEAGIRQWWSIYQIKYNTGIKDILRFKKNAIWITSLIVYFLFSSFFLEKYSCQQTWADRFPSDFTKLCLEHLKWR